FFQDDTLNIIHYGGTLSDKYTGSARLITANAISLDEMAVERPKLMRFFGGDGPFDQSEYTGKTSGEAISLNSEYAFGANVFSGTGNAPTVKFYTYGDPFVFESV